MIGKSKQKERGEAGGEGGETPAGAKANME
jgi:hypothetical protein